MGRYDKVKYDGKTVDKITAAALADTALDLGYTDGMDLVQGSYSITTMASAGTHAGGGVVDLPSNDWQRKVAALRKNGFAAWYRPALPGQWGPHIHAVLVGNSRAAPAAKAQVKAYLEGRNGLANNGPDDGPREHVGNRYQWVKGAENVPKAKAHIQEALELLRTSKVRGVGALKPVRDALRDAKASFPD